MKILFGLAVFFFVIWLLGAIVTIIMMINRSVKHPDWDKYEFHEYLIGFIGSWYTVSVLVESDL